MITIKHDDIKIINMEVHTTEKGMVLGPEGENLPYHSVTYTYLGKERKEQVQVEMDPETGKYIYYMPDWAVKSNTLVGLIMEGLAYEISYEEYLIAQDQEDYDA